MFNRSINTMTTRTVEITRNIVANSQGYREVDLDFRKARASALEAAKIHTRQNRIHCPFLDASRTSGAYGAKALAHTDKKALDQWSDSLELSRAAVAGIAYSSGRWYQVPVQVVQGKFDEEAVNHGVIKGLKHDVHTGILSQGKFDQEAFNQFVWDVHPDLKGTNLNNEFLHSEKANELYITSDKLDAIMEHNLGQSESVLKSLGAGISKFEMEKLLLKKLGQEITVNGEGGTVDALSVRDLHDLYKYGVFPAIQENQFLEAGLMPNSSIAMTGAGCPASK